MSRRFDFLVRVDWWMAVLGGVLIGMAIGRFMTGDPAGGWLRLCLGVSLYAASVVCLVLQHRRKRADQ